MSPEVWFRNPNLYINELVEQNAALITWDRGFLVKKRIDAERFGNLNYPASVDYRMLLIGDQGTAEVRRGRPQTDPVAVYPTWIYGYDDIPALEELLARPLGEDEKACADRMAPIDERPVLGQEHRVVVSDTPNANTGHGRKFYGILAELQAEYPDAILHVHGLYSYRVAFGSGFRAVDCEARTLAAKGKVTLPNGKEVTVENAAKSPQWVKVCGYTIADLAVPRNRCMFNIRAAYWAADHYLEDLRFRVSGDVTVDPRAINPPPPTINGFVNGNVTSTFGDKITCDTCSLQNTCKFYREGSVCTLPDSDGSKLAKHFRTRDSSLIIEGLGALMEKQIERLERGLRNEAEEWDLNPEVTKIIDGLFDKGVKMAKLVDPSLTKPGTQVNILNGQVALTGGTPQELAAQAVRMLEEHGYDREEMTPDLIELAISGGQIPMRRAAIEAHASD